MNTNMQIIEYSNQLLLLLLLLSSLKLLHNNVNHLFDSTDFIPPSLEASCTQFSEDPKTLL